MEKDIPRWALEIATRHDRQRAKDAYRKRTWQISWPDKKPLRAWAKQQGWPAPWFIFDGNFLNKMLENDENFALALEACGLQVQIPLEHCKVSEGGLQEWDALYEERDQGARPVGWGALVAGLREVRRAIEASVNIEIEGRKIKSVGSFLNWTHKRYHMLEDGYDSWIGDDTS